jgi:hypothetical protein
MTPLGVCGGSESLRRLGPVRCPPPYASGAGSGVTRVLGRTHVDLDRVVDTTRSFVDSLALLESDQDVDQESDKSGSRDSDLRLQEVRPKLRLR